MRSESEYLSRRRSRQSTPSGADSVDAPADAAALLLALQRHAGNQAVSRWLERRPLQRSCLAPREDLSDLEEPQDCTDIYTAQSREDVVYDELEVHAAALEAETLRALSAPATPPAPAVSAGRAGSPQQHASSGSFQIGADDDEDTEMEDIADDSDTEDEDAREAVEYDDNAKMADLSEATQLQVNMTPAKLLRAKPNVNQPGYVPKGGHGAPIPLDAGVLPAAPANAMPTVPFRGWRQPWKRKPSSQVYNTDLNLPTTKRGEYGAAGSPAKKAKMVRSGTGNGSRVGWQPDEWSTFLELIGRNSKRTWVMGHFINQRLGGPGRAQNLAPFTYSMNGVHYQAVEKGVIRDVNAGSEVDYTVDAVPGVQGSRNEVDALAWHTTSRGSWAGIAAMVRAGMLLQQDNVTPTSGGAHPVGPAHGWPGEPLSQRLQHVEDWIKVYVAKTFPLGISCRVRTNPNGVKEVRQTVIDNTPSS